MNKILTSYNCDCGCNKLPSNLLKITAGNDFSIELQLTEKVGDEWVHYDMSDMTDVIVSVVSPNGTPTELHSIVDISTGNITAIVDAQKFKTYVIYGIEVLWRDDEDDKRAYAPHVFAFVNSSMEATDSAYRYTSYNPYEYNIQMVNDLAVISIGRIPEIDMKDYYTKEQIDDTLTSYVTYTSLDEMAYATTEYVDYKFEHIPAPDMSYYYTKTDVDTTLESYVQTDTLNDTLISYVQKTELDDTLTSYTTFNDIVQMTYTTKDYVDTAIATIPQPDLSDYYNKQEIDNTLTSYVQQSTLDNTLTSYTTFDDIVGMTYTTKQYVDDAVSHITPDLSDYYNKQEIDNTLTSYVKNSDLTSYVQKTELDDTLTSYVKNSELNDYYNKQDIDNTLTSYLKQDDLDTTLTSYAKYSDLTSYINQDDLDNVLASYVLHDELDNYNEAIATALTYNKVDLLNTYTYFNNYYTKTEGDARYVTSSQVANNYVDFSSFDNVTYTTAAGLCDIDDRVSYIEDNVWTQGGGGGGSLPSDVVTCEDASYIWMLTQSEYDDLETNQQLDNDTFYYISDATGNYVTTSDMNTAISTAIAGVTIDETNIVHLTGTETISGNKTFSSQCTWTDESKFGHHNIPNNSTLMSTDIASGINKSGMFVRPSMLQMFVGQILAPNTNYTNSSSGQFDIQQGVIKFQTVDSSSGEQPSSLTTLAKIDSNGIYEGTTLLANKYVQSSTIRNIVQISQSDYNNLSTPDANTLYIIT